MTGYGDPELLVGDWLKTQLPGTVKVWKDPGFPPEWAWTAPLVTVQRGQGAGVVPLSLDDVTLDIDVYSTEADRARLVAQEVWSRIILDLPLTTFAPSGIFCKFTAAISAPTWAPDPKVYRRTAAYRVILHGFVAA